MFARDNHFYGSDTMEYSFRKENICDGVQLCTIRADGFKTACASVSFVMPLSDKASLYALIPSILIHSSKDYPQITDIEKKLAHLYGAEIAADVTKTGEHQVIKFEIACIDDRFALDGESISDECCQLLFDLIFKPKLVDGVFDSEVIESEKRLLCERLLAETTDKKLYAKRRCEEIMFADEIFGINRLGTLEAINAATPETVFDAYKEVIQSADITVCVSGGKFSQIKALINKNLGALERSVIKSHTLYVEKACDISYVKEQQDVKQGKLVLGFRLGMTDVSDNYAARRVMVDLFGGSPSSKLFTVVREKMSLCYYCSARMLRHKGVMFVQCGIESSNEEKTKAAILAQLDAIKSGDFTDDDIKASVRALEDAFKSVSDSAESLESWFTSQIISNDFLYPEDFIKDFKNVTREDIIKAASEVTLDTVFMLEGTAQGGEDDV